jgi:methionyl aminopeptidase
MIIIKSSQEIERMRKASRLVALTLNKISLLIEEGMSTKDLDRVAENYVCKNGGQPAFKGYRGFPNTLCISINQEVVHGIPSSRKIQNGDLVSIDLGVYLNGYYGDAAISVGVGRVTKETERLIEVTRCALEIGISRALPGRHLSDVSSSIQQYVENNGYSVVRSFVGHGIGSSLHEEPQIPNFGKPGKGPLLKKGMVIAIEPMVNAGRYDVNVLEDNWTVVTADGSLSAHFEHTVAITDNGPEILTQIK